MAKGKGTNKPKNKIEKKNNIEQKKNEKNKKEKLDEKNEFMRLIKIILIVTAIFVVFYLVTIIVTKAADKSKRSMDNKSDTVEKAVIQYDDIMIGTMLNHNGTYYVLIKDADEIRSDEYSSLIKTISSKADSPKVYTANLTDIFNKEYLGKEENYQVSDISEFRVKGTTLVKIVDGKIDAVFDNADAIKNKLSELS